MCRLFGFRSVIQSQVHRSLISAENALLVQSGEHPHGWGVAYYVGGAPHIMKSARTAMSDSLFQRVSGVVASETVLAHIRKATHGEHTVVNTHPFQFGRWVFAHNGNIEAFAEHREELVARIAPPFRRFVLGETDSEVLFALLLSAMHRRGELHDPNYAYVDAASAIQETVDEVCSLVGDLTPDIDGSDGNFLTFIVTNGRLMLAHHGGKELYYSTFKTSCPERDVCPSYAFECENRSRSGFVNHMIFASEELQGENIWIPMACGQIVGVDERMQIQDFGPSQLAAAAI